MDIKFRAPRVWSNTELKKFASFFNGDVVNVSAWKDEDKEGGYYRDYFVNAKSYSLTNFKNEARGFQGVSGEIFLDLTLNLSDELIKKFEVVFNHTTLEHIYEVQTAFRNICKMSKDIVILVVPFLQEMHALYGDFWRFTPLALERMFQENGLKMIHCTFNSQENTSVYVFAIASKFPEKWEKILPCSLNLGLSTINKKESIIGYNALGNTKGTKPPFIKRLIKKILRRNE